MKQGPQFTELEPRASGIAAVLLLPTSLVTITETAYQLLHEMWLKDTPAGPAGLLYGPYFVLGPLCVVACSTYWRRSRDLTFSLCAGFCLAPLIAANFRGSHVWPGTFGMSAWSKLHFLLPIAVAALASLLAASIRRARRIEFASAWCFIILALGCSMMDSQRDIGYYGLYPYTRQYALAGLLVSTLVVIGGYRLWEQQSRAE